MENPKILLVCRVGVKAVEGEHESLSRLCRKLGYEIQRLDNPTLPKFLRTIWSIGVSGGKLACVLLDAKSVVVGKSDEECVVFERKMTISRTVPQQIIPPIPSAKSSWIKTAVREYRARLFQSCSFFCCWPRKNSFPLLSTPANLDLVLKSTLLQYIDYVWRTKKADDGEMVAPSERLLLCLLSPDDTNIGCGGYGGRVRASRNNNGKIMTTKTSSVSLTCCSNPIAVVFSSVDSSVMMFRRCVNFVSFQLDMLRLHHPAPIDLSLVMAVPYLQRHTQ